MDEVDWTGVKKTPRRVAPLTAETFVQRLEALSQRAQDIQTLRAAMNEQRAKK